MICQEIEKKELTIYEDEKISVFLLTNGFTFGHLKLVPKQHITILEQVPDELLSYMMIAANRLASTLFEVMGLEGTNILIQNGVSAGQKIPHFSIDIIPRKNNDNLNLNWEPKKASHESLEAIEKHLKDAMTAKPEPEIKEKPKKEKEEIIKDKNDYQIKQLKHLP